MPDLMASIFALKASLTNGLMSRGPSAKEGPAKLELTVAASAREKSLVIENRRILIQIQRLGHLLHRRYLPPAQALSSPGKQKGWSRKAAKGWKSARDCATTLKTAKGSCTC